MSLRGLFVFSHDSALGNAPARVLFDLVRVERKPEAQAPRAFSDYSLTIDEGGVPGGVTLTKLVG
jgi:CRISPR-associated protein Csd2